MSQKLELWGGVECTISRIGHAYRDQCMLSGHADRPGDFERFASLGLTALRHAILWEKAAPVAADQSELAWADAAMAELHRLKLRPIVGLIHHGAGPHYTSLIDPSFAPGLAAHARRVVERYPWVEDWCPVNEPLTTARFSALYGFWSPHLREERSFWLALFNQIDAVRLCMREIRRVRSDARLIQTEDLGFTHARPATRTQAEFENLRRWLTWDLLAGRVDRTHPLFERINRFGLADRAAAIVDDPCPPDIVGVNHYLSSERILDERLDDYPESVHGGNGTIAYADVEAVRVVEPLGLAALLRETHARYGRPIAVTECHNGCTREEQMRWFLEVWRTADAVRAEGLDVRAVTAWALLGATDWASLLTRSENRYEVGVFDARAPGARETAMTGLLRALAQGEASAHPVLEGPGWWRRPNRYWRSSGTPEPVPPGRPILITGRSGTLGQALARACTARGLPYLLTSRAVLDVTCPDSIAAAMQRFAPWAVINAAGYVRVDEAEADEVACLAANAEAPALLAAACAEAGARFVTFSSDLVFNGALGRAYIETDLPTPLNMYGRSKAEAERRVRAANPSALVVRTAAFFSPDDPHNFPQAVLHAARNQRMFRAARDLFVTPTYVPDLVQATLDLLIDGEAGVWHLSNAGRRSWAEFALEVVEAAGLNPSWVEPAYASALGWRAPRPRDVSLASARGQHLPSLEHAVARYADEIARTAAASSAG